MQRFTLNNLKAKIEEFGLTYNSKIESQIELFVKRNKYTYLDIARALYYYYCIQEGDLEKSKGGIGIVPYVMEDTRLYFQALEKSKAEQEKQIKEKEKEDNKITIICKRQRKKRGKLVDINNIYTQCEEKER